MSSSKSHLLDPLNVLSKLALLTICEPKTKLSIYNHVVSIQRPDFKQSALRLIYGDGVNDLHLLLRSVIKIVEWYIIEYIEQPMFVEENTEEDEESNGNTEYESSAHTNGDLKLSSSTNKITTKKIENKFYNNQDIKELMIFACDGLEILQRFYEQTHGDGMFMPGIQLIVNTLRDGINGKLYVEKLPVNYRRLDTISLIHIRSIVAYWKDSEIKHILKLLKTSEEHIKDKRKESKENNDTVLLNKGLRKILNGYVESILSILTPLDNEFQNLVLKSYL